VYKKLRNATNQFTVDQVVSQNRIIEHPGSMIPLDCQNSGFTERHRITQYQFLAIADEYSFAPDYKESSSTDSRNRVAGVLRPRCAVGFARQRACDRTPPATWPHPNFCGFRRGSAKQWNSNPVFLIAAWHNGSRGSGCSTTGRSSSDRTRGGCRRSRRSYRRVRPGRSR